MIKLLSIRNYGANQRLDIELGGITCIIGKSYRGKSWVLRALRWVALNRPAGFRFIRWGAQTATVALTVGRRQVKRLRSKTVNKYQVDDQTYKAFGNNVPEAVRKVLNLGELNFQVQQELPAGSGPLFWFALAPGQVSKRLNQIVDLEIIDRSLSNIQREVHHSKTHLEVCSTRYQEAKEQAESLTYVSDMAQEWAQVRRAFQQAQAKQQEVDDLRELLEAIQTETTKLDQRQSQILQADESLKAIEALQDRSKEVYVKKTNLQSILWEIKGLQELNRKSVAQLQQYTHIYQKLMKGRCPLCQRKTTKS